MTDGSTQTEHPTQTEHTTQTTVELRRGAYHDSVSLMQVSQQVARTEGITAAQVAMATELNVEVLTGMGFDVPAEAAPNDLVIALRGESEEAIEAGLAAVESALAGLRSGGRGTGGMGEAPPPRTLGSAARVGEANLALISVPGQHAVTETFDAINAGLSVMLFSDNVSVEDEIRLKDAAREADVLVMGPDCGTALVRGVALGFCNVVQSGSVGLVAASGTGAQQVMALLDAAGVGVSHCLGVGGRDLKADVAGRSTRQALAALADDPETTAVIVVSKPPDAAVLAEIDSYATELGLDVHWATLGEGRPDLTGAVEASLEALGVEAPTWPAHTAESEPEGLSRGSGLRGLFCGGTLADEASIIAGGLLAAEDITVIDFGDDEMTQGRAHPMIDPSLRMERIAAESQDPTCGVLLLDLVLGHGSHPDPADDLADAIRAARERAHGDGRALPVVVSLTGTENDPQGYARVADVLAGAGASVFLSNAAAVRHAVAQLKGEVR